MALVLLARQVVGPSLEGVEAAVSGVSEEAFPEVAEHQQDFSTDKY